MQFGAPKSSPGTSEILPYSRRYKERSFALLISSPFSVFSPKK